MNLAELDPRTPEGKATQKAVQNSRLLVSLFDIGNEDLCIACKCFRLVSVDVGGIAEKDNVLVNCVKAPCVVVLNGEGKAVGTLGPGPVRKNELLAAMTKAVQPKTDLQKTIAEGKDVIKEVLSIDTLKAALGTKQKTLEASKGGPSEKLTKEIERLTAEIQARESALQEREAKLYSGG